MGKFDNILQKEVTRKEFLAHAGIVLLAIFGIPGMLGILSKSTTPEPTDGFGSGVYR